MTYGIYDNKQLVKGGYKSRKIAQRKADKMNLEYGAEHYSVQLQVVFAK